MAIYDICEAGLVVGRFESTLDLPSKDGDRVLMICVGSWILQPNAPVSHTCEIRIHDSREVINQGFTSLGTTNIMFELRKQTQ